MNNSQKDLFHVETSHSAFNYGLIHCAIFPQPGVELDISVIGQREEDIYTYRLSLNPGLDILAHVDALQITAWVSGEAFLFRYSYEDLLVSLRTEAQMQGRETKGVHPMSHQFSEEKQCPWCGGQGRLAFTVGDLPLLRNGFYVYNCLNQECRKQFTALDGPNAEELGKHVSPNQLSSERR